MDTEKHKRFLIHAAYYGTILAGLILCLYFLLPPLTPFIIGFFIAWALYAPSKAIAQKLRIRRRVPAILMSVVFYLVVISAVLFACVQLVAWLREFLPTLPSLYTNRILPFINKTIDSLEQWLQQYDPGIAANLDAVANEFLNSAGQSVANLSSAALKMLSGFVTALPSAILKIILTVVATFFTSLDFDRIIRFVRRVVPEKTYRLLSQTVHTGIRSIRRILLSYILVMLISFAELSLGFLLMRIPYAIGIALLVAVIDIMPILGTGLILIPWSIVAFAMKNIPLGLGMALLYIIMLIVRNMVEPKLVGSQIGLRPLVTLMSMVVGLHLFGILGLLLCPIALSTLCQFAKSGRIPLLKRVNPTDSSPDSPG